MGTDGDDHLVGTDGPDVIDALINAISAPGENLLGGQGRDKAERAPHDGLGLRMSCRSIEIDRTHGACR